MRSGIAHNSKTQLACGVALGALAFSFGTAFAQAQNATPPNTASGEASSVSEVIVTANKREQRLRDVAMGVSALTGDELETRQLQSFVDFAPLIPGLSIQSGTPTENRVTIRGLNAGGAGASVGIYVDDSPIGSSNGLAGGATYTVNSDTWDLQRIEVLRGPQGTLYGANTEGGLIKYVTTAPNLSKFSAIAQAGAVGVDGGEVQGSAKGVVNIPLADGRAGVRISGFYEGLPGFIDDPQLGLKNVNGGFREGARLSSVFKLSDTFKVRLNAFYQHTKTGAPPSVDVVGNATSYAAPPSNQFDPSGPDLTQNRFQAEPYSASYTNVSLAFDWSLPWATLTSVTSYAKMNTHDVTDVTPQTITYLPPVTATAPAGTPVTYGYYLQNFVYGVPSKAAVVGDTPLEKYTEEVRLASSGAKRLEWQLGLFGTRELANLNQQYPASTLSGGPVSPPAGGTQLRSAYNEVAIFGTATYHFTPRFDLEAGGRYAWNRQSNHDFFQPGVFSGGPFTTVVKSDEDVFTYSVAPRFHLTDDTLVYARVASGYKPGGPNNITIQGALPPGYPSQYGSETTTNYELGLRTKLFDDKLTVDVAAFDIEWDNIQIFTRFGNFSVRANGGKAFSRGVEWSFGLQPLKGLNLLATGSYVDAEIDGTVSTFGLDGQHLPYVPQFSGAFDATYRWRVQGRYDAYAGGTVAYQDERTTGLGSIVTNPIVSLPAYATLALRAGVSVSDWRAELYMRNVTDERGINVYIGQGTPGLHGSKYIIDPRTIGVTLTRTFG